MSRTFNVLRTLGGCGGTIVARALAANGALVLSEVNPRCANIFSCALNPYVQVSRNPEVRLPEAWEGVDPQTLGAPDVFDRFVADLAESLDQPLLIRDYSYIDYIGVPFVWPRPSHASLPAALEPLGGIRSVLLVRHPAKCLRSLLVHVPLATVLTEEAFVAGHLAFYDDNADQPVFRYEDFVASPEVVVASLCDALGIPHQSGWRQALAGVQPLTGHGRAVNADDISAPVDRVDHELDARLAKVPGYDRLLALGGYGRGGAP